MKRGKQKTPRVVRLRDGRNEDIEHCKSCMDKHCRDEKKRECARLFFVAIGKGAAYECEDRVPHYLEQLCA